MIVLGVASEKFTTVNYNEHTYMHEKYDTGKLMKVDEELERTVWSSELSHSIDESFMKFDSPPETRLRVSGEDKARVPLDAHGSVALMGIHTWWLLVLLEHIILFLSLVSFLSLGELWEYREIQKNKCDANREE